MLPATLLSAVEAHKCFTGCYRYESPVVICTDAALPLSPAVQVSCADCLSHYVGALTHLLPAGMTGHALAAELSAHMRNVRGYRWALSGYHTAGGGFWLSAASLTEGLFLVDGSRNYSKKGTDAELLADAFKHHLAPHLDTRMLDPALYSADYVHLDLTTPLPPVTCKNDVLTAAQCSLTPRQGARRVAVLEFLPLSAAAAPPANVSATRAASSAPPAPRKLRPGEVCPVCHAEYTERPLFTGSFVGCLC
jgi:hypothetical protein